MMRCRAATAAAGLKAAKSPSLRGASTAGGAPSRGPSWLGGPARSIGTTTEFRLSSSRSPRCCAAQLVPPLSSFVPSLGSVAPAARRVEAFSAPSLLLPLGLHRSAHARRPLSTAVARLWDMIETRSLNPTNPVLDDVDRLLRGNSASDSGEEDNSDIRGGGGGDGGVDAVVGNLPNYEVERLIVCDPHDEDEAGDACAGVDIDGASLLPNFSRLKPHHLVEASEKLQAEYDEALEEFEKDLEAFVALEEDKEGGAQSSSHAAYDAVVVRLDTIASPLQYVENLAEVFRLFCADDETTAALGNVRVRFWHERSSILGKALRKVQQKLAEDEADEGGNVERLNAVKGLLGEYERRGVFLDDDEAKKTVNDITGQQREAEKNYIQLTTQQTPGQEPSPREVLSLMYEILSHKSKLAELLGYSSWAEWSLQNSMAGSVDAVFKLHDQIADRVLPRVTAEMAARYEKSIAEKEDLRAYFELENVLGGMFDLSRDLFGVEVAEAERESVSGWHNDVRLFHLFDERSGCRIGSFYLDPYDRRFKTRTNVVGPILHGHCRDGMEHSKPAVFLGVNVRPPVWDTDPVHLTHDDVVSLFHEFGHVLQHLMADVELGGVSGVHGVEVDACEFVSQFMEYWPYEEDVLRKFAVHVETGESISSEQVRILRERWIAGKQIELCRHLFRSQLELIVNSGSSQDSLVSLQKKLAQHYIPHESLAKGDLSPLMEIFGYNAEGYHTACYRYVWSEVMSADAFAAFKEAGALDEKEKMRDVGMLLRKSVLEAGSAASAEEAYRRFCGREATPDALFKQFHLD